MKTITLTVSDEVAERMRHHAVYLDVFGHVRWNDEEFQVVEPGARWQFSPEPANADARPLTPCGSRACTGCSGCGVPALGISPRAAHVAPAAPTAGSELIAAELARQIAEGAYPGDPEAHHTFALITAARSYVGVAEYSRTVKPPEHPPMSWPFDAHRWTPTGDAVRDLATAGALIARAIDELLTDTEENTHE